MFFCSLQEMPIRHVVISWALVQLWEGRLVNTSFRCVYKRLLYKHILFLYLIFSGWWFAKWFPYYLDSLLCGSQQRLHKCFWLSPFLLISRRKTKSVTYCSFRILSLTYIITVPIISIWHVYYHAWVFRVKTMQWIYMHMAMVFIVPFVLIECGWNCCFCTIEVQCSLRQFYCITFLLISYIFQKQHSSTSVFSFVQAT